MAPHFTRPDAIDDQPSIFDRKRALRRHARLLRHGSVDRGDTLAAKLVAHLGRWHPAVIAGYCPIGSEIDPWPALRILVTRGARIALPRVVAPGMALEFVLWAEGEALVTGAHGTRHTQGAAVRPDLVLVPLLAYDRRGYRLGQGGGYYDRTLAALPCAVAIGCAYAAQEVDMVPIASHDIGLHAIATERGVITCRPAPRE